MYSDYIERKTSDNVIIRVNNLKATYLVIRDGAPLLNPDSSERSIVHAISSVYFVGPDFQFDKNVLENVDFYHVENGYIRVPFYLRSQSDVRHLNIATGVNSLEIPLKLFYFSNLSILPKEARRSDYILADQKIEKEGLTRLRTNYPQSMVVEYLGGANVYAGDASEKGKSSSDKSKIRAIDLMSDADAVKYSRDPVFAARIHLRRLEWGRMSLIPNSYLLKTSDVIQILTFLKNMLSNIDNVAELSQNKKQISSLYKYFILLNAALQFNRDKIEALFRETNLPVNVKKALLKALQSQEGFYKDGKLYFDTVFRNYLISRLT